VAVDSINKFGISADAPSLKKYMKAEAQTISKLPKIIFTHTAPPREKDLNRARNWLK
jgi:NitT/TauT family transport system substrate-binding protein